MAAIRIPQTAIWNVLRPSGTPPRARSSHCVWSYGSKLFVFGGEHEARVPLGSELHVTDLADAQPSWATVEITGTPPSPRNACSSVTIGSKTYIFGGRQGISMEEAPLNDMHVFDAEVNSWSQLQYSGGTTPVARSFHGMATAGGLLYVFGGCAAVGRLCDLHSFNPETRVWSALPGSDAIQGRGGAAFCAGGDGKLYVVAGFTGKEERDVHQFDPMAATWSELPMPDFFFPRSVCASAQLMPSEGQEGGLLVFGGEVGPSEKGHEGAGSFTNELIHYSATLGWSKVDAGDATPAPSARGWTPATFVSKPTPMIALFGGLAGDDQNPQRLDDLYTVSLQR